MTARSKIERLNLGEEMDRKLEQKFKLAAPAVVPQVPATSSSSSTSTTEKTHLFKKKEQGHIQPIRHPPVKTDLYKAVRRIQRRRYDIEATPDPFVGIPEVFGAPGPVYERIMPGMSNHMLYKYLVEKDAVMIFFYDDTDPISKQLRPAVKEVRTFVVCYRSLNRNYGVYFPLNISLNIF